MDLIWVGLVGYGVCVALFLAWLARRAQRKRRRAWDDYYDPPSPRRRGDAGRKRR